MNVVVLPQRPVDRRGHPRTVVTLSEHRRGQAPANKGRKFPPEPLSTEEVSALVAACAGQGCAVLRDRAIIVVGVRAGLRVDETLSLMPKDIREGPRMIDVLHGKGDRARTIPIDAQAMEHLSRWLERRRELGFTNRQRLFCTIAQPRPGLPMWDTVVRDRLKQLYRRAGISKRAAPHQLRHTYATHLAMAGVPVHAIRQLLGHRDLSTTERYIRRLWPGELAHWIDQLPPWDPFNHSGAPFSVAGGV